MPVHALMIPSQYDGPRRLVLRNIFKDRMNQKTATTDAQTYFMLPDLEAQIIKADTLIVAQEFEYETIHAPTNDKTFSNLARIKAKNPDLKIVVCYTGRHANDSTRIRATTSFKAAARNDAIDLIYADLPMNDAYGKPASFRENAHKKNFARVLETLVNNEFEGRVRSPELVDITKDPFIMLGDLRIDRELRVVRYDEMRYGDFTETQAAILGTLATYQNSWVPMPLMMKHLYTPEELARGKVTKMVDVYIHKLNTNFAKIGHGAIQNIAATGRFVRPSDFRVVPAMG